MSVCNDDNLQVKVVVVEGDEVSHTKVPFATPHGRASNLVPMLAQEPYALVNRVTRAQYEKEVGREVLLRESEIGLTWVVVGEVLAPKSPIVTVPTWAARAIRCALACFKG